MKVKMTFKCSKKELSTMMKMMKDHMVMEKLNNNHKFNNRNDNRNFKNK